MVAENLEIRKSVRQLLNMLDKYPDDPKYTYKYTIFLKLLLKIQSPILPVAEVMTLIKYYSPIVFSELKRMSSRNMMLQILIEQSMDIDLAKDNIEKYTKE